MVTTTSSATTVGVVFWFMFFSNLSGLAQSKIY